MVLDRQRQALYEEREKLYEEYRYLKKEYADLDKASQTIDDYLESLRDEPECKNEKGRVRITIQTGIYLFFIILFLIPKTTIHILYGVSNIRTN